MIAVLKVMSKAVKFCLKTVTLLTSKWKTDQELEVVSISY